VIDKERLTRLVSSEGSPVSDVPLLAARDLIDAILTAISEQGYVIVPKEPTTLPAGHWGRVARSLNTKLGITLEAILAVVSATRAYLPPDGIDAKECLSRVIAATDNPNINPIILEAENAARLRSHVQTQNDPRNGGNRTEGLTDASIGGSHGLR
jgi:hypothetical protein